MENKNIKYSNTTKKEIIEEIKNIGGFLKVYTNDYGYITTISLKGNISFKQFNNYCPKFSKEELIHLFDEVEKRNINIKYLYD